MEFKSDQPRGYSIPTIDLAYDKDRQIVVDKEAGQYLGHPTTVLLDDDRTMICVYPKGHGKGAIVMKKSFDGGLTWSDRLEVPDNWATSREVPTIYPIRNAQGTMERLIMFSGLYPIRMARSEDLGETWTPLEPVGDYGGVVACADLMRTEDGNHMAVFHDDGRFIANAGERCGTWTVYKIVSEDNGITWSDPIALMAAEAPPQICEPGLVRSPDGGQIAMLLRENSREYNSFVSFSDDEGESWTDPVQLPGALTGDRHQGIYAPDGRLFISFRDTTHETPTKGDWVGWIGTYEDIAEGREGQYRVRVMENHEGRDCAYPAIELLPDGTIATTTYGHWIEGEEPFIMSVRFTMDEIDEKEPMETCGD
ncbi:MAG: sialidase family protein [Armatimonadota bacterium]